MIELWEAAKRTNLSNDELESLKVVLTSLVTVFMFLDTLLPCLFLNDTFCFNVVLQSNFDFLIERSSGTEALTVLFSTT